MLCVVRSATFRSFVQRSPTECVCVWVCGVCVCVCVQLGMVRCNSYPLLLQSLGREVRLRGIKDGRKEGKYFNFTQLFSLSTGFFVLCFPKLFNFNLSVYRISVGTRCSKPAQTHSGANPTSSTMCAFSFSAGKLAVAWWWPLTPSIADVKEYR